MTFDRNLDSSGDAVDTPPPPAEATPSGRRSRSSSLKSGKTPQKLHKRKKFVRFADSLGLDLVDVKTFSATTAPVIPRSAFRDLTNSIRDVNNSTPFPYQRITRPVTSSRPFVLLMPMFHQPGGEPGFVDRMLQQKVCLENSFMGWSCSLLQGVVRVQNLAFEKRVVVRYTTSEWISYRETDASYVSESCDGFSDRFRFTLNLPQLLIGQRVQFCIRYIAGGGTNCREFWDNNRGNNFVFQCMSGGDRNTSRATIVPRISSTPVGLDGSSRGAGQENSPSLLDPWSIYDG